jgi:hypothetical protein
MKCDKLKRVYIGVAVLSYAFLVALAPAPAAIIVNDSWADGDRADTGGEPLDSNWWTSASSQGIEVAVGSLGMVTGTSGRGIHTIFPTQTLANVGDKLVATYTFTTPATVGSGTAAFRAGLFDTLGRAGLNADVSASSGTPNAVYGWGTGAGGPGTAGLPGYMLDMDVATTTASNDFSFRSHTTDTVNGTGRLMGTTTGFTQVSPTGPDGAFAFTASTAFTGSMSLTRVTATDMELTATLGAASHTITDAFDSTSYGMLAFWANSNIFGSSGTPNTADNGIDFSNVTIEFIPVPEPATLGMLGMAALLLATRTGPKRSN